MDHGYDSLNTVLSEDVAAFVRAMTPETDAVADDLRVRNVEAGFPIVGPEVGGVLRLLARLARTRHAFEFGTDFEASNLETAREFFERGGYADRARFEVGDAIETYRGYDGPFDLVLLDNGAGEYVETFELVREDVPPGGVVCADNVMTGAAVREDLARTALEGDPDWDAMDESTRGIVEYLLHVREDDAFETVLLPVGEGLTISVKR